MILKYSKRIVNQDDLCGIIKSTYPSYNFICSSFGFAKLNEPDKTNNLSLVFNRELTSFEQQDITVLVNMHNPGNKPNIKIKCSDCGKVKKRESFEITEKCLECEAL